MFKKGLFWTIIFLMIFSISGYAYDYTYTQQSGVGFFVGTADKADALEDSNELRQIINDLGALLVHSKMDGLYPKDLTTGGTIQIPEAGLKFSNAPVNDDMAAYIAGEMTWQTKVELGLDLSLYYLKTEIDAQGEMETIWGDTLMNDLIDDTTPEYGGAMDHNNERDTEVKTVEFNGLYDNGNSGATPTINWQNGNYQKIAVSENTLFTFSNAFIGTITLQITYSGAFTAGFNAGYTILEEGGIEITFTETLNAVDILKVMYLGTANNYVVGLMADVKD